MPEPTERAALILLLRRGKRPWHEYANLVEQSGGALALLDEELGMFARSELPAAAAQLDDWRTAGHGLETVLDSTYPENLRAVHDRPPILFVAGTLTSADARAVAVIGAREASRHGVEAAREIARVLVRDNYTVVSGLAAGIDAAAHSAALGAGGRTVAVIGTGVLRSYPPENADLQRRIAREGAVVSRFWPDAPPRRRSFPMRNAVMSGLSLATVVVEAGPTSGSRIQVRLALAHGRPVFLMHALLAEPWARELAQRPGTYVIHSPAELTTILDRLTEAAPLTA